MATMQADDQLHGLYTAVVGDVLDTLGLVEQFLPASIRPITPDMVIAGRAMPVRIRPVSGPQPKPFGLLTEALDQLEPGEIYVAEAGGVACASWGELLTVTARTRGCCGAVIDGYHRDTSLVLSQSWPVFSAGAWAPDAAVRSSVTEYRVPVTIGGVLIRPGDLIFGDRDGVVVVPGEVEAEVIDKARAKASAESQVRTAILGGMSATEAFATYGVL